MSAHWFIRFGVAAAIVCSMGTAVSLAPSMKSAPTAAMTSATRAVPSSGGQARGARHGAAATFLTIPRLRSRLRVREGVSPRVLAAGVGHYPGTARPGEIGNVVFLGHRTTHSRPFRNLHRLRPGDPLVVSVGARQHVYRVYGLRTISSRRRTVLAPVPFRPEAEPRDGTLTLITCHPPGSDRQRLVVLARSTAE